MAKTTKTFPFEVLCEIHGLVFEMIDNGNGKTMPVCPECEKIRLEIIKQMVPLDQKRTVWK